ncbi:FAD-dependent oxidoreductase [Rhodobacter sp. Har01]|uniref:NAD(P)/FAD-dependent oxidoreductase n=1 Tax=Rhodobacter sp. Har01 TaxID=2883999 RepID=UPI001D061078|nr:FAD-dependent oxidoreductase [Rhodobacter sp. Har01]MCB6179468.1 FAD-dependent oxidoreductase [Rhodobacter sp. Har01]
MPFETSVNPPRRIAVVGGGISGMSAAHLLAEGNSVVLFESESRLGGHARTLIAGKRGDQPVDTGFIVYNRVNYPHLVKLFEKLDVPVAPSSMSFAASIDGGRVEYGLADLNTIFAQRRNALSPRFLGMITDILRFNKHAETVAQDGRMTIRELLDELGTGAAFRDWYITPFSGAIWSTPTMGILDFPAKALVQFFKNHALLSPNGQHQWYTVRGGSVQYVSRLQALMARQGVDIRLSAPIAAVRRDNGTVQVRAQGGTWEVFDDIVFATHSDVSLRLLSDPTPDERSALGAVRYQPNEAVLHADTRLMPQRRKTWSSWNYVEPKGGAGNRIDLTYWMNALQPIPPDDPLFVTLNATQAIRADRIHDVTTFRHPVYDLGTLAAQDQIRAMNGTGNTWFCGAWMKNGFHEDGIASAHDVVEGLQSRTPLEAAA